MVFSGIQKGVEFESIDVARPIAKSYTAGKEFQTVGPATEEGRRPRVVRR